MNVNEGNIIIFENAMKKIMIIFLGPFLTAYFIQISEKSIINLSFYYIACNFFLAFSSFFVARFIKRKFQIEMFRIGVILNFFYILSIILLKEQIVHHLFFLSILYGLSASTYYFPYNLFVINKVDNANRTNYTVKSKNISSIIGVLCPLLLGSIITVTNYQLTAIIILLISFIQIIFSFLLTPDKNSQLSNFDIKKTWKKLKDNRQIRRMFITEFFMGISISDSALEVLMTLLIFESFKTNLNLGMVNSMTAIASILLVYLYGKKYKNKDDQHIITIASIVPIVSMLILLLWENSLTLIIYNTCYVIFAALLLTAKEIRLFNLSDSKIVDRNNQSEFLMIREAILNLGRITGYLILLLAGITKSQYVLNIVMVLLTFSILFMGFQMKKIEKFEK